MSDVGLLRPDNKREFKAISIERQVHRKDRARCATDNLLRRRSKERETDTTPALSAHDDQVSGFRFGRAKDLAIGASKYNHIVDLDPCAEAGRVRGIIVKKLVSNTRLKGYVRHASQAEPQYVIKTVKTDHVAIHKGEALAHVGTKKQR